MKNISKISKPVCTATKNFVVIICKNISLDILRRRKHNKEEKLPYYIPDERNETDPYVMAGENEIIQVVAEAVHELPNVYKDCMYMELVLEFNYKEIADILGQKPETVRKRLQRGKKILGKRLKEMGISCED